MKFDKKWITGALIITLVIVGIFLAYGITSILGEKPILGYYLTYSQGNFKIYAEVDNWPDHLAYMTTDPEKAIEVTTSLNSQLMEENGRVKRTDFKRYKTIK